MRFLLGFLSTRHSPSAQVAWLQVDTQTILTIHGNVITKNHRIKVTETDQRMWQLHIREVRETDRGWYMCQLNTDPMKSQQGYLDVVGKLRIVPNTTKPFLTKYIICAEKFKKKMVHCSRPYFAESNDALST